MSAQSAPAAATSSRDPRRGQASDRALQAFLPAALEIQETPPSPTARWLAGLIAMLASLALLWSWLGQVEIHAVAEGKVIPTGQVKHLQPLEAGIVSAIHVTEGATVRAGDVLIELDRVQAEADLTTLEGEATQLALGAARDQMLLAALQADAADQPLRNLIEHLQRAVPNADPVDLALHERQAQSQYRGIVAGMNELRAQRASREHEMASLDAEVTKLTAVLPLIEQRAKALKALSAKGMAPELDYLDTERTRIETQQNLLASRARHDQLGSEVEELEQRLAVFRAEREADIAQRLDEQRQERRRIEQELNKATDRSTKMVLRAPVDGTVQELAVHTVGGVVTPAERLMSIVPTDGTILVEAWLENKDIGFVHEGQPVTLKIHAFPFIRYGTLSGHVQTVSRNAVSDEERGLLYRLAVALPEDAMSSIGNRLALQTGMGVVAEVKTGQRRVLEFLLDPIAKTMDEGLRER